jgi:hypothetical protein
MKDLLESDLEIVCRSGFMYLPLLFDPSVAREIEGHLGDHVVVQVGGRHFVRTMSLRSVVGSYEALYPKSYEELRRSSLKRYSCDLPPTQPDVSERLKMILFSVVPHFVRRGRSLDRRSLTEEQLLDFIGKRIGFPDRDCELAGNRFDPEFLRRILADLKQHRPAVEPPAEEVMPARALGDWLSRALEGSILEDERQRLTRILNAQEQLGAEAKHRMRILFHIAEKGALEIDDFGFCRTGAGEEYLIYKHTGEYALRDFYGRLYLFPDCRVAVSTSATLKPFVVETYKHPFLEGHDSGQEICLRHRTRPNAVSGAAVVEALEEGINALLYGYSSRRRNGYHSLERLPKRMGSPGFGDSPPVGPTDDPVRRKRHILDVDFDEYRIPSDHAKIISGQVEITNNFVP